MFIFTSEFKTKLSNILRVMVPIFITQVAIMGMNFSDTVMSGQAGTDDLAGVAIGANIWMPVFTGINGLLLALTPIVAHLRGGKRNEEIGPTVFNGMVLGVGVSVAVITLGCFFLNNILDTMTLTPVVRSIATKYLIAIATGMIPLFLTNILRAFVDTMGYTQMTMRLFVMTLPVNVVMNYIFIFGKFGMPRMGGVGAGVGSAITYTLLFISYVLLIHKLPVLKAFKLFQWYGIQGKRIKEHLAVGIPMGTSIFCETSIFGVVALFISRFGTEAVAGHQAAINFTSLLYMLPLSFSLGLTIIIGVEVGARRLEEARRYAKTGRIANLILAAGFAVLLYTCRSYVAALYSADEHIIGLISKFLFYGVAFQFCDSTAAPIQGVLRGYKDVKSTFYSSLVAYWVISLPAGLALDRVFKQGPFGYWQGLIIGIFFSALFLSLRLRYIERKTAEA